MLARLGDAEWSMGRLLAGYEAVAPLPGDPGLVGVPEHLCLLYVLCDRMWVVRTYGPDGQADALHGLREGLLQAGGVGGCGL